MPERKSMLDHSDFLWLTISHRLQEIFGGNAVSDEYGIGRHVANLFVTQTYEGQSDIHGEFDALQLRRRTPLTRLSPYSRPLNHRPSSLLLIASAIWYCRMLPAARSNGRARIKVATTCIISISSFQ